MNAFVLGTRAELIKTFPIMLEMQRRGIPFTFIHTGQHEVESICDLFGIQKPDVVLNDPPKKSSHFAARTSKALFWNFKLVKKIQRELQKIPNLKYVFYHGDTMTTATAAIASSKFLNPKKTYQNVHIEAGLRSGSFFEPFPEEISRQIADKVSDVLLAPTEWAKRNLEKEKVKGKIIVTGNTVIDSALLALKKAKKIKTPKFFALCTIHRHENITSKERLEKIISILEQVPMTVWLPLHDNTKKKLADFGLLKRLEQSSHIEVQPIRNYPEFIFLENKCSLLLTDGGSIQEESLLFQKPCILLRKGTERPEGLSTGLNYLSHLDVEKTVEKINEYVNQKNRKKVKNPYGEKDVSKQIVRELYG